MMLDMANALRPSELFCLRWRSFLEVPLLLDIQETLLQGENSSLRKDKAEAPPRCQSREDCQESGGMARRT